MISFQVAANPNIFGNGWKEDNTGCTDEPADIYDPCDTPEKLANAVRECSILADADSKSG